VASAGLYASLHPMQTTMPTSHHSVFYRPDALPDTQPTASKHWRLWSHSFSSFINFSMYSFHKDSWKEYMEKLMNEENEWDHRISATVKEGLADCIRIDEFAAALKKMKRYKAPGLSGLVAEMIQATGDIWAQWILDLCNGIVKVSCIPEDCKWCMVLLIYKGKWDPMECGSYRGIKFGKCYESGGKDLAADWYRWYAVWFKNWVVVCWPGCQSPARCRIAYTHLMPLPLTVSCSSKSSLVFPFWSRLTRVVLDTVQGAIKRL